MKEITHKSMGHPSEKSKAKKKLTRTAKLVSQSL